ncbi:MAG: putative transcriptional regulator [Eubacterium sp.]|jgi:DNA-binding PadR family transcriptional regulator|nr:putative transcriptional regulator [Eubacterium sp.]
MSIKHAILGLLSWKPSTGYDLKKTFEESSSMYWSGNNNQIYKTLVQLKEEGLVTSETEHQEGLPSKKIYTITGDGVSELKEWVISAPEAPEFKKAFLIQLAWSELLSNEELFDMLTKYENEIKLQLLLHQEKIRRGNASPARTQRETFIWNMIDENILSSYRNELEWIQNLRSQLFQHELNEEKKKINFKLVEFEGLKYMELFSLAGPIKTEQDALELIALCGECGTNLLMLHSDAVSEDFYTLRTGVAGKVLQKFVNYYIKLALVVPDERLNTGKFRQMASEANRGNHFRVFSDNQKAQKWLMEK